MKKSFSYDLTKYGNGEPTVTEQIKTSDGVKTITTDANTGAVILADEVDEDSLNPVTGAAVATAIAQGGVPEYSESDAGKVLQVDAQGDDLVWAVAGGAYTAGNGITIDDVDGEIAVAIGSGGIQIDTNDDNTLMIADEYGLVHVEEGAILVNHDNTLSEGTDLEGHGILGVANPVPAPGAADSGKVLTVADANGNYGWATAQGGGGGGSYTFTDGLQETAGSVSIKIPSWAPLKADSTNGLDFKWDGTTLTTDSNNQLKVATPVPTPANSNKGQFLHVNPSTKDVEWQAAPAMYTVHEFGSGYTSDLPSVVCSGKTMTITFTDTPYSSYTGKALQVDPWNSQYLAPGCLQVCIDALFDFSTTESGWWVNDTASICAGLQLGIDTYTSAVDTDFFSPSTPVKLSNPNKDTYPSQLTFMIPLCLLPEYRSNSHSAADVYTKATLHTLKVTFDNITPTSVTFPSSGHSSYGGVGIWQYL